MNGDEIISRKMLKMIRKRIIVMGFSGEKKGSRIFLANCTGHVVTFLQLTFFMTGYYRLRFMIKKVF